MSDHVRVPGEARPVDRLLLTRSEVGAVARREGKTRIGGHLQPCLLAYCRRPECRGWIAEDARIRARAAEYAGLLPDGTPHDGADIEEAD